MVKKVEMEQHYEPWSRTEIVTTAVTVLLLFSILGYAIWVHYPRSFEMRFTVKMSMVHINYPDYTQVITTDGIVFYLYDYHPKSQAPSWALPSEALEVGRTYTFEVVRNREPLNGVRVYDVVGGDG